MEDLGQIIATNLTYLRKKAGLTQLEFGEKFNYTDKTVSRWENGSIIPAVDVLKKIADFYGVSIDYLTTEHKTAKEFNVEIGKTIDVKNKNILISLGVTVVWLIAVTIYVASIYNLGTANFHDNNWWSIFLWAVPASCLVITFFIRRWFKGSKATYIVLSIFVWSILIAAFITFLYKGVYWYLFFIGLPIQVALILLYHLNK